MANGKQGTASQLGTGALMGYVAMVAYLLTKAFMPETLGNLSEEEGSSLRENVALLSSGVTAGVVRVLMNRWVTPNIKTSLTSVALLIFTASIVGCAGDQYVITLPSGETIAEVESSLVGRGAHALTLEVTNGEVTRLDSIKCQDGTSQWSVANAFGWLVEVAAVAVPFASGATPEGEMAGASAFESCGQLLETSGNQVEAVK